MLKTACKFIKNKAKTFRSSANALKPVVRDLFPDRLNIFAFLIIGFAVSILLGFLLLLLPVSNSSGEWGNPLVVFFTSTSAVTDTGLVLVDTSTSWTTFGQVVIMFLIQIGGLGFMLSSAFLIFMAGQHAQLRDFRVADAFGATNRKEFKHLLANTIIITAVFEAIGILIIAVALELSGARMPWWSAIFHSVSAFNNAGFDILHNGASLTGYAGQPLVLAMFALLSFAGAFGVTVFTGIYRKMHGEAFTLDTKLALSGTMTLFIGGALLIFVLGWLGSNSVNMDVGSALSNALFLSITSRTAGFTAINLGFLPMSSLFTIMILMFIGGVSGSTAGGIKVNTFAVLSYTASSYTKGKKDVEIFHQRLRTVQVHRAVAVTFFAVVFIFGVALLLSITEHQGFIEILFETISAFSTVGLSIGETSALSTIGQILIIITMIIGRLGPLTLALAIADAGVPPETEEEKKPLGTVQVG